MGQRELIKKFVYARLLQYAEQGEHAQKATLANLRRGIGKKPGALPKLWGDLFFGLPEELMGQGKNPSHSEWAVYLALTMYALHQQGNSLKTHNMHRKDIGLGEAVRQLAKARQSDIAEGSIISRFNRLVTASDMEEIANHLRSMIQLLRTESIALDYVKLAEDLYLLQFADSANEVRLRWGRDYYRRSKDELQEPESAAN